MAPSPSLHSLSPKRPSSRAAAAPPSAARVALWQGLTLQANMAYERGHDVRARQLYEEALVDAEAVFAAALAGDEGAVRLAPLLYGMTCNNLVALGRRRGDAALVGAYLERLVTRLVSAAESIQAPLELKSRCALHLRVASFSLIQHCEQSGLWDAAREHGERADEVARAVEQLERISRNRAHAGERRLRAAAAV